MRIVKRWLLVAGAMACCAPVCASQGFRVDPSTLDGSGGGYWAKWDSVQDRLILYRDTSDSAQPSVRIFAKDGASTAVYSLRDLSESKYVDIWGVAATPDGGILLATIVGYTPRGLKPARLKSFLLTYDAAGNLKKVWEMEPYHHHLLAVDRDGNVFALGDSDLAEPYFLIIKYSPTGKILREFLPSSLFPEGDKVIDNASLNGDCQMFIKGDVLFVWLPRPQEVFRFSLSGKLLSRTSLAKALSSLVVESATGRATVKALTAETDGDMVAQVQLWPKNASEPVRSELVRLTATGSGATVLPIPFYPIRLLGTTAQGKLVLLQPEAQGKAGWIITW